MLYQGVVVRRRKYQVASLLIGLFTLKTILAFAGSVTLNWERSPDPNVVGYRVHIGATSGNYTNSASVGDVTNAIISNLNPGVTYYFAATAINVVNDESDFSNEAVQTIPLPANEAPTLNAIANVTINEGAPQQTISLSGISSGSASENQTLTVTASSSDTSLIPNPTINYTSPNSSGSLNFTPVALAYGSATITVTVNDGASSNNIVTRTFSVTVNPVNQAPTLDALANLTLDEGAGLQSVNLSGISSGAANENQTLVVNATSSNTGLIPNPTVNYTSPNSTGTLTFTPAPLAFGSATITVTVNDGSTSNNIVTRTFNVTVNSVNQAPTLNALANLTINENAGQQTVSLSGITSGATNESQTLVVTASSSNTGLIPTPTITYTSPNNTGTLRFTPAANSGGTADITVTVNDGGTQNNTVSRTFSVTVNRLPVISTISNQVVAVNSATTALPFTISDTETSASSLTVTANSSNLQLVKNNAIALGGSNGNRTVLVTPETDESGTTTITLTVSDGSATATSSFELQVLPKPAPPGNFRIAQAVP